MTHKKKLRYPCVYATLYQDQWLVVRHPKSVVRFFTRESLPNEMKSSIAMLGAVEEMFIDGVGEKISTYIGDGPCYLLWASRNLRTKLNRSGVKAELGDVEKRHIGNLLSAAKLRYYQRS